MQKKFRILSILLVLSMILSPISLAFSNIANAEEDNIGIVEQAEETKEFKEKAKDTQEAEPSDEKEEEEEQEQEKTEGLEETNRKSIQSLEDTPFEFDEETGTITGYKGGNPPVDLEIPEEINGVKVKHIGDKAFYYSQYGGTINKQLNSVVLPEGLESIGYMAFQKNNFTEIELPNTLTTLGQRSFSYNKLTTIEFPEGLKSIGEEAFQENEFTEIEIPSYIEEIQEGAFNNNKIEKITLYDGLKTIGGKAFHNNSIDEIIIPDTVDNWPTGKDDPIFRRNNKDINNKGDLILAKVYNNSGATAKNTFGIVNPASVTIEYKDSSGEEIKPSKTIVGKELKIAEKQGTAYSAPIEAVEGSGKDLLNYDAEFGHKLIEVLDEISENYYQMNKEYRFEPEEIEDYPTPEKQTVTLNERENTITFTYTKEGEEPEDPVEDLTKPAKIELSFPGGKQVTPLYPGGKQIINTKVFNGNDEEVKGEKVTFESSNPEVLKHSFMDTFKAGQVEEETEVTITATLKSNPEIKGEIKVLVTPKVEENQDEKYIEDAINKLEADWFKLKINSDKDKNVNTYMENVLKEKGFGDIKVSVKSSDKEQFIDLNGDINYRYDEKYLKYGLQPTEQVLLNFEFSKCKAKGQYEVRTVVGWDRDKVRKALKENIIEPMSDDLIGENESFDKIKEDFELPRSIEYTGISWESSDESVLRIEESSYFLDPHKAKVIRGNKDKDVELTAKVKFNHDDITLEEKYNLTVLALDDADNIEESMQKLLDENYTVDKLKDSTNGKFIDPNNVVNDIQLIRPRDTEIKDYDDYRFKVTSDNDAVVINNKPITYRANVYRPLPGEKIEEVNLTVNMIHKEKDIRVSKVIPIKITPLTQEEIDDEIKLMKLTKENYFKGIKGDNESPEEITSNLKSFREANLVNGELVWTYHIDNDKNTGIYPDELEGWESQEKWRIFRSSKPDVITHENLLVKRPKTNTDVKIESTLSSQVYGKYAVRYPEREDFQKLYRQDVSIELTVIGKESVIQTNLDEEIDFLKQCYEAFMIEDSNGNTGSAGLSMLAPGAARLAGMDVDNIQKHLYIDDKNESAYQVSQSIITLIGADLDPRQYKDKTGVRNLVQELVDSQTDSGEFVLDKGITGDRGDQNSIEAQARSIIALDMSGADYDREKIVSKLMEIYDKKDGSHTYKDIKTEGIVLVALSNHKDIDGVNNKITEILNYLKTQQNEDGGFDIKSGFEKGKNSPTATGRVIQGLIANGINPLENEEWIKNDSTILDAIVKSKTVKDNMKHSGYGKGEEDKYTYYEATSTAFGALMDLKNQKSMFELLKLETDSDAKPDKIEIVKPSKGELEVGQSLPLIAKIYDEDGKVISRKELIWTSSDEDIATVKDGNVKTKGIGEATITVKIKDTEIQDTFKITVVDEIKTLEVNTAIIVFNEDGEYEIKSNPQKATINKDKHDGGLTVFGSLQATTNEYEGSGNWITSIYGITGPSTGGWMFTVNGKIPDTTAGNVKLNEGDNIIWFCTYDWKRDTAPTWEELTGKEPEEKLTINIISDKKSIKIGEELALVAEVRKGDTILTDQEIMWLSSNAEIATIEEGKLIGYKAGEVNVTATLVENKDIKDTIKINVIEKDLTIEDVIGALREYYSNKDEFTFREAIGYNYTSENLEKDLTEISSKFKTNEDPKSASEHVGNIIGLISAGKDPYNYNNKDYVKTLSDAQNEDGKFIIGEYDDYSTTLAFSILALDMADGDYNRDKAIAALISYQKADGGFGGVDETGMVLTALAKYKDKSQVQTAINKGLNYLKGEQDSGTGGFIVWGGENPYSASAVLQGLLAVGEDPLSEEWTKDGKTIVDSLMNFYKDGHFEKESEWTDEPDINSVTEQAFIALADVYKGQSMFNEIKLNINEVVKINIDKPSIDKITEGEFLRLYVTGYDKDNSIVPVREVIWTSSDKEVAEVDTNGNLTTKKPGKVTITAQVKNKEIKDSIELEVNEKEFEIEYIGDMEFANGKQADARVKIKNLTEETKPATLIVTLCNKKTNRLLNYSILKRDLQSKEEVELATGFLVPSTGNYSIRALLWEDLENQNIIMQEAKGIKVAN